MDFSRVLDPSRLNCRCLGFVLLLPFMLDELCKAVSDCVLNHHPAMSPWLLTATPGWGEYRAPSPQDPNEHITPCFLSNSLPFTAGLGKLEVIFGRMC